MRIFHAVLMLCSLFCASPLFAADESPVSGQAHTVELLLERAINQNLIAGGVVVIGNHEGILSTSARGQLSPAPGAPLLNDRTVFDVASLTKVIATAPAVMKLLDQGLINLSDPLSRWFPEFAQAGHGDITILNLLTHTSGLEDFTVSQQSMEETVKRAAAQRYRSWGGVSRFHYADINFILLGELVRRVSGEPLDAFCRQQIYAPLGTRETTFLPSRDLSPEIAPTSIYDRGVVQDPNARRLGGVAGHAGLFSSAYDLSRYARLMLGRGMIDDRRILSAQVVAQMTTPYLCNGGSVKRGLGWDMESPFSAPKGSYFSEASFGHTGYSGSSIWIDPQQDLFVILLTRRLDYHDVRDFNQLRRDVSTVAAAAFQAPGSYPATGQPWEMAKISARLLQPISSVRVPASKIAAQSRHKGQFRQLAQRRSGKGSRFLAKSGSHRITRLARVARADKTCKTGKSSKKRRALARS